LSLASLILLVALAAVGCGSGSDTRKNDVPVQTGEGGVDKKGNSAYGRGTTAEDKKAGNTSLEFHESCHIEDLKKYLDSHPLPEFTGKEGMTVDEFKAEVAKYDEALKKYWEAAGQASEQSTDCVGTKASFCK